jgi:hypothetical protein
MVELQNQQKKKKAHPKNRIIKETSSTLAKSKTNRDLIWSPVD